MITMLPIDRPVTLSSLRFLNRRGIVIDGHRYSSPELMAVLPSLDPSRILIRVDPAAPETVRVILQQSATEMVVPMVMPVTLARRGTAKVALRAAGVRA